MPKKEVEKNNKGTKRTTKASTSKSNTKKVVKVEKPVTKVEVKEVPIVTKETKKGNNKTSLLDNTPFVVCFCIVILLTAICIYLVSSTVIPTTSDGKEIIASVNGKDITADELYKILKEENGKAQLLNIIDEYISEKEVTLTKDDEAYIDDVVKYYTDYAESNKIDFETFLIQYVGLSGIKTEKEFKDFVTKDYKKTLAIEKYISDEATEEELKDFYKENFTDSLTAKHILIQVDIKENATEEEKKAAEDDAYNKAKSLIKKLDKISSKELDKEFEKLAEKNSDDTGTYANGGLIENFTKKEVDENFYNAAYELKDGEYTKKPIKSQYGYHVILKVSSTPVEKYKEIKDKVKKSYAENKLTEDQTLFVSKWAELRKEYKLIINDKQIKKSYNNDLKTEEN